jgi:sugar diacid utilization regulator
MNVALIQPVTFSAHVAQELPDLFVLSSVMSNSSHEEEILLLAGYAVPAWSRCDLAAAYLVHDGKLERSQVGWVPAACGLDEQVTALEGTDGLVGLPNRQWSGALALRGFGGLRGYLVVSARTVPAPHELFLLRLLAQQVGLAVAGTILRRAERENGRRLRLLTKKLDEANDRLTATMAEYERRTTIQRMLTKSGGEQAIADALHALTGLAVAIEDPFGNLRCWSGQRPPVRPKVDTERREEMLRQAVRKGSPVRDRDRVLAVARPRHEILGTMALVGSERSIGTQEMFALEQGAAVLGLELAHRRNLAEAESRLRGDLVNDLVSGGDPVRAFPRAEAIGHDLHDAHQVLVVHWPGTAGLPDIVDRATAALGMRCLLGRRPDAVVLVATSPPPAEDLYDLLCRQLGTTSGAVGVGGLANSPADLPRSFQEALQALEIRRDSHSSDGVVMFDDLGLYRILHAGQNGAEIERYIREWLGPLLDYDRRHHTELTDTLFRYLECGGNYASTAESLVIHRSTLRYRLRRIRDIGDIDLHNVDSRLNLHVAARAWHMLTAHRMHR